MPKVSDRPSLHKSQLMEKGHGAIESTGSGGSGHRSDQSDTIRSNGNQQIPEEPLSLMDLENGRVGWESATDPMNPR